MTFKEVYPRIVDIARRQSVPVRWKVSLGWDMTDRVRALAEAVEKKRISAGTALNLLTPEARDQLLMALPAGTAKQLPGKAEPITRMLPGFPGLLQRMRMEDVVPAGCDPGLPKPEGHVMTADELKERRSRLRHEAQVLRKRQAGAENSATR
jgi:hypothetical protein